MMEDEILKVIELILWLMPKISKLNINYGNFNSRFHLKKEKLMELATLLFLELP